MGQHTEGPWHVNAVDNKRGRIVGDETADPATWDKLQVNGANCTVANVFRPRDARLIAAAPDMLALLERVAADPCIVGCAKPIRTPWPTCYTCDARAILSRIKGE